MEEPRRVALRDYLYNTPQQKVTLLRDFVGEADAGGVAVRVGDRIVKANNNIFGAITGLPAQFKDNWAILSDSDQRRNLARALIDDSLLTGRRRKALFSILLWGTIICWLLFGIVVGVVNQDALGEYQSGWSLFFYSLGTSIFLPTPFEILLSNAVASIGIPLTIFIAAVGKTAGSWIVLLMGDKANEGLQTVMDKYKVVQKIFNALEAFARKFGLVAIFIMFAIPLMTDTAPLFVLALLKMKKGPFLAVTFVAIVVRSLLWIYLFS